MGRLAKSFLSILKTFRSSIAAAERGYACWQSVGKKPPRCSQTFTPKIVQAEITGIPVCPPLHHKPRTASRSQSRAERAFPASPSCGSEQASGLCTLRWKEVLPPRLAPRRPHRDRELRAQRLSGLLHKLAPSEGRFSGQPNKTRGLRVNGLVQVVPLPRRFPSEY